MASLDDETVRQEWATVAAQLGPWSWNIFLSTSAFDLLGRYGRDYYVTQSSVMFCALGPPSSASALWGPTAFYHDGATPGMMILTSNRWIEFRSIHVRHCADDKYPTLFPPGTLSGSSKRIDSSHEGSSSASLSRDVTSSGEPTATGIPNDPSHEGSSSASPSHDVTSSGEPTATGIPSDPSHEGSSSASLSHDVTSSGEPTATGNMMALAHTPMPFLSSTQTDVASTMASAYTPMSILNSTRTAAANVMALAQGPMSFLSSTQTAAANEAQTQSCRPQPAATGFLAHTTMAHERNEDPQYGNKRGQDSGENPENHQSKKRAKKAKEPRPSGHIPVMINGWSLFKKAMTPWIRSQYPESKFEDWSRIASKMWKDLTNQQRADWLARARDEHQRRFPEYTPAKSGTSEPSTHANKVVSRSGTGSQSVAEFAAQCNYELPQNENQVLGLRSGPHLAHRNSLQFAPQSMPQFESSNHDQSFQSYGIPVGPRPGYESSLHPVRPYGYQRGVRHPSLNTMTYETQQVAQQGRSEDLARAQQYGLPQMSNYQSTGVPSSSNSRHQVNNTSRLNSTPTPAYYQANLNTTALRPSAPSRTMSRARVNNAAATNVSGADDEFTFDAEVHNARN
ncbi:hypothetical protein F5Y18DRAFT_442222 [Xylariaceae sp. FL1019]|nr:hypothetical protein F5Y18DRAFT_442222 [Xylariaceae sp. FL1019]